MITYEGMLETMQIFLKYAGKINDPLPLVAQHDQLFIGPDPIVVSEVDKARLKELGWFEEEGSFCLFT